MSTIEEAQEQARAAKASVDTAMAEIRLGKSIMRELDKDILALRQAQDALATLLDATEPPAHDESCEADWGPEGQESPCRCATPTDRPAEDEREAAELEAERRWPSPSSGLYEGLRIGFQKGAEWAKGPRPITDEMVGAALDVCFPLFPPEGNSHLPRQISDMRAALEAAEEARR